MRISLLHKAIKDYIFFNGLSGLVSMISNNPYENSLLKRGESFEGFNGVYMGYNLSVRFTYPLVDFTLY